MSAGRLFATQVAEWTPSTLLALGARNVTRLLPFNMVVTNVPGPQIPLFCAGARLEGIYPQVPLLAGQGLGVAVMSYAGRVCWGFNSDPEVVPDAEVFAQKMAESLERVREAAAVATSEPAEPARKRAKTTKKPATPTQEAVATAH